MIENRQSTCGRPSGAPDDLPYYVHPDEFIDPDERNKVTGEPIWVQNKRRAILKEQSDKKHFKNYTCQDCGTKVEKYEFADHAKDCRGKAERTYLEKTYDKNINALNEMELMKSVGLEINYSHLKPGMKVKIKSWDKIE